jgi:ligand-binding sensor domain-containing protein/signal transduction histidine kinase
MPSYFKLQIAGRRGRLRNLLIISSLCYLCGFPPAVGGGQEAGTAGASEVFAIETWRTDRGLPQNSVNALIQSREGYLWLGTYNGLVRFDGVRFTVFDAGNTPAMRNSRVTSLYEDSRKTLWIGHETGELTRMAEGAFHPVNLSRRWPGGALQNIGEDERADIWLLSIEGSAMRLRDGLVLERFPGIGVEPGGPPEMVKHPDGRLIVSRNGAVAAINDGKWSPLLFDEPAVYYSRVLPAHSGGLWVASSGLIRRWLDNEWVEEAGSLPAEISFITTMVETRAGQLLFGSISDGLFLHKGGGEWLSILPGEGLPQKWIKCLAEDREGNLWVGTRGGLSVLRPRKVVMRSPPDEWQTVLPLAVSPGRNGTVWAGSEGAGLYHFDGQGWRRFGEAEGMSNPYVWSVIEDSEGSVWAGTWSGGLFRGRDGRFAVPGQLSALKAPIVALLESPAGSLWIGTGKGLARFKAGRLEEFASFGGAAAGDIRALVAGENGEIWVGTLGAGLGRFANGIFQTFTARDGLPGDFILSLHHDTNGTLWIGTLERGLCRLKNGRFVVFDARQGLPSNVIGSISEDDHGKLWFNSSQGIFAASKADFSRVANNPERERLNCLVYGISEGLETLACSAGFTPSGFRAGDGRFWFPNANGLAVVNPDQVERNHLPPPVMIEEVSISGKPAVPALPPDGGLPVVRIPPGGQQVEIRFTALSFSAPEKVRFKWRLDPLEAGWSGPQSRRLATYSYLHPGKYVFQLSACNNDGLWSSQASGLEIIVLPHFWETWWFKVSAALLALLLFGTSIVLVQRARTRRKLERAMRERGIERERARIAQDIHDDLGASLTRIGMLSQTAGENPEDLERTTRYLTQIYATAREMTRSMDEIVWAVNPRHDTLESLFNYLARFAHEFLAPNPIRCRLLVPVEFPEKTVPSDVRHNLFLAFKETLNNVVRHSGADEVQVRIQLEGELLKVVVADNGHGARAFPDNSASKTAGRIASGHGFANIQARLERIGGRSHVLNLPGEGFRVELWAPLTMHRLSKAESSSRPLEDHCNEKT